MKRPNLSNHTQQTQELSQITALSGRNSITLLLLWAGEKRKEKNSGFAGTLMEINGEKKAISGSGEDLMILVLRVIPQLMSLSYCENKLSF